MADADTLWLARLRREQLIELLEGRPQKALPVRPREPGDLKPESGEFAAVWRDQPGAGPWPMPQALIVEEEDADDLLAWATTYLRAMGPLTAQVRVLSPARMYALLELSPLELRPFLGGAVGLVLCEALMHARHGLPLAVFGASASRSTLSYALLRAKHLGFGWDALAEIAERFERLRRDAKQPIPGSAINAVLGVAQAFLEGIGSRAASTGPAGQEWLARLMAGTDTYELAEEILSRSADLLGGRNVSGLGTMTAEERVRLLDEIAPTLLEGSAPRLDRAFALALASFVCRPGLEQQASLLSEYARRLPEAWLWLGVMQCRSPLAEVLSSGDAAGWWIARELLRTEDPFSPPRADVAASELAVMLRGRSRYAGRLLTRGRVEVEILPMVSVVIRGFPDRSTANEDEGMTLRSPEAPALQISDGKSIVDVERAIEQALRLVRTFKAAGPNRETSDETSTRPRRKR